MSEPRRFNTPFPVVELVGADWREILLVELNWFNSQSDCNSNELAQVDVLEQLHQWLTEGALTARFAVAHLPESFQNECQIRLWQCWAHHWKQSIVKSQRYVTGQEVARSIRSGIGFERGGNLGGDPLLEIVLVHGVCAKLEAPTEHFIETYRDAMTAVVRRLRPQICNDDDWWCELLDKLAGYTQPRAKLLSFRGRCGLRNYLTKIVANYICDLPIAPKNQRDSIEISNLVKDPSQENLTSVDCAKLLAAKIRSGLDCLEVSDRLAIAWRYEQELEWTKVAALLHLEAAGSAKRRVDRAINALRSHIFSAGVGASRDVEECLEEIHARSVSSALAYELTVGLKAALTSK